MAPTPYTSCADNATGGCNGQLGFSYTTREMFDLFYPGYGESWPTLQGSLGILWEQAGVRGLVVARDDERLLRYSSAVRNHYVSGIATLESVLENREALLRDHRRVREDAASLIRKSGLRDYFILESGSPQRAARLVRLLQRNSIEVHRVREPLFVQARRIKNAQVAGGVQGDWQCRARLRGVILGGGFCRHYVEVHPHRVH